MRTFHRESIIGNKNQHYRESTVGTFNNATNKKNKISNQKNRKEKFKSYFKHYLNSNNEKLFANAGTTIDTDTNKSLEKQQISSGGTFISNTLCNQPIH